MNRGSIIIRSLINAAIWLFMISAAVGVWSSYQQLLAIRIFLLVLLSGGLYFLLIRQQPNNLWIMLPILSAFGIILISVFLLTQDWHQVNADIGFIDRIGAWWMALRPDLPFKPPHQNMVAGVLSMIIPLNIVWLIRESKLKNLRTAAIILTTLIFLTIGLLLTSSRGAWISLFVALVTVGGLGLLRRASRFGHLNTRIIYACAILAIFLTVFVMIVGFDSMSRYQISPSSVNNLDSRVNLYRNALSLVKDQWILGGGLGSFAGLYSSYILILPVPIFFYSHNLYIDILLEQGIFGLIAWLTIVTASIGLMSRSLLSGNVTDKENRLIGAGILASLLALSLHGLVDNPFYAEWGKPLLLVLPGMTLAVIGKEGVSAQARVKNLGKMDVHGGVRPHAHPFSHVFLPRAEQLQEGLHWSSIRAITNKQKASALITLLVILITIGVFIPSVRSAWYANIGSIRMAKSQLSDWPTGKWPEKSLGEQLATTKPNFDRSLKIQASNLTANYRMGLIEFYGQNYPQAEQYLSRAYQLDDRHRGILKTLGYTYVWLGEFDRASDMLSSIPEAKAELGVYTGWWRTHDRDDLAQNAELMIERLDSESLSLVEVQ